MGGQSRGSGNALKAAHPLTRSAGLFGAVVLISLGAMDPASSTQQVGVTAAVNRTTFGTPPGATRQVMVLGDNVIHQHRIETTEDGLAQILLNDGSTFTVGPGSNLVIDDFIYDPDAGTGSLVATLSTGAARFVGGKLSKTRGGVSVKTPVGTIGIRGGIANLSVNGNTSSFSLIFGNELTFDDGNGTTQRVYQPGYTLEVGGGAGPFVRPTTRQDLGQMQGRLSGRSGQQGGANTPPNDGSVNNSGFPGVNSNLPFGSVMPPPKPLVVYSTEPREAEQDLAPPRLSNQERVTQEIAENQTSVEMLKVRILTPGDTYSSQGNSDVVVTSPGAQGLIGGAGGLNGNVSFSLGVITSGSAVALVQADVESMWLSQFIFSGSGNYFYHQSQTEDRYVRQSGDSSSVPAPPEYYAIPGDVVSYARGVQYYDYDQDFLVAAHYFSDGADFTSYSLENMALLIYGKGTDFSSFGLASDPLQVRHYDMSTDPTLMFSLGTQFDDGSYTPFLTDAYFINPLVAAEFGTDFLSDVVGTGLYVVEASPTTLEGAHMMAGSFLISGNGENQQSFASLFVAEVSSNSDTGNLEASAGRRGSHRLSSTEASFVYNGGIYLLESQEESIFFGDNANYAVLGADLGQLDDYGERSADPSSGTSAADLLSGSFHLASLSETTNLSELDRTSEATLMGYAAGSLESSFNYAEGLGPTLFASISPDGLEISASAADNTFSAQLEIFDNDVNVSETDTFLDSLVYRFGESSDGNGGWRAVFIDDDTYAARNSTLRTDSYLETDGGDTVYQVEGSNSKAYFVPNTLVGAGDNDLFQGVDECTCAFLEWGYWGVGLSVDGSDSDDLPDGVQNVNVHLGTWVAGNILSESELPSTGTASYAGHAVGNVISGSGNRAAQYLAAGNFEMNVDFGSRTGSASVSDFDGRNFSATLDSFEGGDTNLFYGGVSSSSDAYTIDGLINTSIVDGPDSNIQGVVGDFHVRDGDNNWQATGIVAGEKQ